MTARRTARRKPTRAWRAPRCEQRALLNRRMLTTTRPSFAIVGGHDCEHPTDKVQLLASAPTHFFVDAVLERDAPFLWIGINSDDDPTVTRTCWAIIGGDTLRTLAADILRFYPPEKNGGAR